MSTHSAQAVNGISSSVSSDDGGITNVNVSDGVIFVTGDIHGGSVRSGSACVLCCVLHVVCAFMQCGAIRVVICGVWWVVVSGGDTSSGSAQAVSSLLSVISGSVGNGSISGITFSSISNNGVSNSDVIIGVSSGVIGGGVTL